MLAELYALILKFFELRHNLAIYANIILFGVTYYLVIVFCGKKIDLEKNYKGNKE